jgi:predicted nucleic acid-binding protein
MSTVFADTSFYVALVNPRDAVHAAASMLVVPCGSLYLVGEIKTKM